MTPEFFLRAAGSKALPPIRTLEQPRKGVEAYRRAAVRDAVTRGVAYLEHRQRPDGHLCAELEADATLEADLILFLHFIERTERHAALVAKAREEILRRQMPEGGWNIFPGGPEDVSASVKAYFALKLAGVPAGDPVLARARAAIERTGGVTKANTYTRFYLALFGQYDWAGVPEILPETMLLPAWFPLNLYNMSSWTRAIVVPLMILNHVRPRVAVPPGRGIDELRSDRAAERTLYVEERNGGSRWKRIFLGLNALLRLWNRHPVGAIRRAALRRASRWVLERLRRSDGLGAIWPGMINSVFALKSLGHGDGEPAYERAVEHVLGLVIEDADTLRVQPCKSPVWDTVLTMCAWTRAGKRPADRVLTAAGRWLLDREVRLPGDWQVKRRRAAPGGWYFEYANEHYPDLDDTAVAVMALAGVDLGHDQPLLQAAVDRAVAWAVAMQSRDGGWGAFDADNTHRILCEVPFADHNAMLDPSTPDITARVLEMAGRLGFTCRDPVVARAVDYLRRAQEPDGSWFGRWGVNYIYGTGEVLVSLNAVGYDMARPEIERAARWLEGAQNPDGGWGERPDSYGRGAPRGRGPSTASQTAWALLGLMATGRLDTSAATIRGIEYLLRTQSIDGSWEETSFTGTGFPSVFYLRYHFYPQYFPVMALAAFDRGSMTDLPRTVAVKPSLADYRNPVRRLPRPRFPLKQSLAIGRYILGKKLRGEKRFPLVLMLEPLHRCNLACAGCGRIREYHDRMGEEMPLADCLASAEECGAPVVSVCGGEPLIYGDIVPLVEGLVAQGRYVYLCTNGWKLADMAPRFRPSPRLIVNVHLDGFRALHESVVRKEGLFDRAVSGIAVARKGGLRVTTNTTFYAGTTLEELETLFAYLKPYGVEGHTISPAYAFELAGGGSEFFLSPQQIKTRFAGLRDLARRYPLLASPVYLDFLLGDRTLPCTPWANPTRNVAGWRAPCYLLMDSHYPTYREYLEKVDWEALGPGNDSRCADCQVHAGFEPSAALGRGTRFGDGLRMALWQLFSPR